MIPNTATMTAGLTRDGKAIPAVAGNPVTRYDVPADRGRYRLDLAYTPGGDYWVDTSWEFTSKPGTGTAADGFQCWDQKGPVDDQCQALPTIAVDYDLDLRADNTGRPGIGQVKFRPHHVGDTTSRITSARLSVSYDGGKSWQRVHQLAAGDGWTLGLVPQHRPGGTVSLRVEAADEAGNTVRETITNAYRVAW
jgi:hypothetical protein